MTERSFAGSLGDEPALEVRDGAEDVEQELASRGRGVEVLLEADVELTLEFELVLLEDMAPELLAVLTSEKCISRDLCRRGFAIVDKRTRSPLVIHDTGLASSH